MDKKIRAVGTALLVLIWLALTGFAWFGQRTEVSEAERRPLAQRFPFWDRTRHPGSAAPKLPPGRLRQWREFSYCPLLPPP